MPRCAFCGFNPCGCQSIGQTQGPILRLKRMSALQDPLNPANYGSVREEVETRAQRMITAAETDLKRRAMLLYIYRHLNAEGVRIGKALDQELEQLIQRAMERAKEE